MSEDLSLAVDDVVALASEGNAGPPGQVGDHLQCPACAHCISLLTDDTHVVEEELGGGEDGRRVEEVNVGSIPGHASELVQRVLEGDSLGVERVVGVGCRVEERWKFLSEPISYDLYARWRR